MSSKVASLDQISVGILSWNNPGNLNRTLKALAKSGLLTSFGDVTVLSQESHPKEIRLARTFGIEIIETKENIGIGPGYARLVDAAKSSFFLFLENDFECIEPAPVALTRMQNALDCLTHHGADAVKLRHRHHAGHPDYSRKAFEGRELPDGENYLLDSVCWRDDPALDFPEFVWRLDMPGEPMFFAKATNANFTNNPVLHRTDFVKRHLLPRLNIPGTGSEAAICDWWAQQEFTVARGTGLFKHNDPYKEWRRLKRRFRDIFGR